VAVPQRSNCNGYFKLAVGQVGNEQGVVVHRPIGGGATYRPKPKLGALWKNMAVPSTR